MKTFSINQVGCARSGSDMQKIHDYLCANGFIYVKNFKKADLILVNTCGFHKQTEDYSLRTIEDRIKRKKKEARIIILGCLPKINVDCLKHYDFLDIIGFGEFSKLDTLLSSNIKFDSMPTPVKIMNFSPKYDELQFNPRYLTKKFIHEFQIRKRRRRMHIRISHGCLGNCTYCSIKSAKGQLTSRPLDNIKTDLEKCLALGTKVILLENEDLGSYGIDINCTVVDLLKVLFAYKGKHKFILLDFNPQWLIKYYDQLIPIFKDNYKNIKTLTIPIQSGSDRILKKMNRPYQINNLNRIIMDLKKNLPKLFIEYFLIIGFPGETENDFKATKDLVRKMNAYSDVELWIFRYCDRPNTAASRMDHKLSAEVIDRRVYEIKKLAKRSVMVPSDDIF